MNDETSNLLTDIEWRIPAYAQGLLWVDSEVGAAQVEGERGDFSLPAPVEQVTICWGGAEGIALNQLRWRSDSLEWVGEIRNGGLVTAIHISEWPGLDTAIAIVHLVGQPLRADVQPYPGVAQRPHPPYPAPDAFESVDESRDFADTTWLVGEDSALLTLLHDALLNQRRVHLYGRLPGEHRGWHRRIALPILLEGVTLFGP